MFKDVKTVVAVEDGNLITGTVQDCTPYAERTKSLHNGGFHGTKELKHAATLPMVLVEKYCNDKGITFREFMNGREHIRAMCNDPALKAFRVWPGRV